VNALSAAIQLVPYSDTWPELFRAESALLRSALARWLVGEPEHIGSTAVQGLLAKPVIDIMAPVASLEASRGAIEAAATLGYCHFPYKAAQMHWFCKPSPARRTHHLHLIEHGSALWHERLAFRDALRADPALAARYRELKAALALRHPDDREAYTEGKTSFVEAVLGARRARSDGA
jgi:GrpB-like predicted nucleotidyltransferase (UPF0157 family)